MSSFRESFRVDNWDELFYPLVVISPTAVISSKIVSQNFNSSKYNLYVVEAIFSKFAFHFKPFHYRTGAKSHWLRATVAYLSTITEPIGYQFRNGFIAF